MRAPVLSIVDGPVVIALILLTAVVATRQAPAFDAVSIKENEPNDRGGSMFALQKGRWRAANIPVTAMIASAWGVPQNRLIGAPDWARVVRYDVTAVAPEETPSSQQWPMVQAMLRERFKVAVRKEQRDLAVYNLVPVRPGATLGPSMRKSAIADCFDREAIAKIQPPPRPCTMTFGSGTVTGTMSLDNLAITLTGASGREVFNRTNLPGFYEIDLKWAASVGADPDGNQASIFTAVQEQLGLKLESATAPLDVLIVDHVEKPTAN